ncbi:MAG: HNH endonuclease [Pseudomonadales bacterium]|nr:HNH endonuclease [Pseudomonadales bacterium]
MSSSITHPLPSADEQLLFLQRIQLLLTDATFTSTYKFALLLAITELSVEMGQDTGEPLAIPLSALADKTIELYWQQTLPYVSSSEEASGIFLQNTHNQAAIIRAVLALREAGCHTLAQARHHPQWLSTRQYVAQTLKKMPIQFLQNINGQTLPFLYQPQLQQQHLVLIAGTMFCLRQFQAIIQQLVRQKWIAFIQKLSHNQKLLGEQHDLESFLFGTSRTVLAQVEKVLKPLQDHRCFFCGGKLQERGCAVDHFIPWSRYPRDTALNFVVAHGSCNGDKSDLLAAEKHLVNWLTRNEQQGLDISGQLQSIGFNHSPTTSKHVAQWAYQQAIQQQAFLWVGTKQSLEASHQALLSYF